jgi:uncharacterized membrane protein YsdA (DUF1294 family)
MGELSFSFELYVMDRKKRKTGRSHVAENFLLLSLFPFFCRSGTPA